MPGGPKPKKPTPPRASPKKPAPGRKKAGDPWACPGHLTGDAREAWRHLVGLLRANGNLGRTDPTIVEAYCVNLALLKAAYRSIKSKGAIVNDRFGAPAENPAVKVINASTIRLKGIAYDLGLVPATSKYAADPDAGDDQANQWEEFGIVG